MEHFGQGGLHARAFAGTNDHYCQCGHYRSQSMLLLRYGNVIVADFLT
jgi:hypothetical protein